LEFDIVLWVQDLAMKAAKVGHAKMACYVLEGYNLKCEGLNEVAFRLAEDDIYVDATHGLPSSDNFVEYHVVVFELCIGDNFMHCNILM
jgi:hypothetical protein